MLCNKCWGNSPSRLVLFARRWDLCVHWMGGASAIWFVCTIRHVWHKPLFSELPRTRPKPPSSHRSTAAVRANGRQPVSELCGGAGACERTLDIPRTFGTGARLARRKDGEKCSGRLSNIMGTERSFLEDEAAEPKQINILPTQFSVEGSGEEPTKNRMEISLFLVPTEGRQRGAQNHHALRALQVNRFAIVQNRFVQRLKSLRSE